MHHAIPIFPLRVPRKQPLPLPLPPEKIKGRRYNLALPFILSRKGEVLNAISREISAQDLVFISNRPLAVGTYYVLKLSWPAKLDSRIPMQLVAESIVVASCIQDESNYLVTLRFRGIREFRTRPKTDIFAATHLAERPSLVM